MLQLAADHGEIVPGFVITPFYRIVPGDFTHVRALAENLRTLDRAEIAAQGIGPYTTLRRCVRGSLWYRTAFVGDDIAAMFGLGGDALGDLGRPWLLTTAAVERVARPFVVEAKRAVQEMLLHKPKLENYVLAEYSKACRLLQMVGFALDEPAPFGPNGTPFRRFHLER